MISKAVETSYTCVWRF